MASVALDPASTRSHAELAEVFNAGYESYFPLRPRRATGSDRNTSSPRRRETNLAAS